MCNPSCLVTICDTSAQRPKLEIHILGPHLSCSCRNGARRPSALPTPHTLALWFDNCLTKITYLITSNTPSRCLSSYSKPWWTPTLSFEASITTPHASCERIRPSPPRPPLQGAPISKLFNPPREWTGPSSLLILTQDWYGILGELQPADLHTVSPHLKKPPPPPKSRLHFFNIFFTPDPHFLHPSYFLHLRTLLQFHHQKCPHLFENPLILALLGQLASPILSGSASTRPINHSSHLCLLLSSPTDITPKP